MARSAADLAALKTELTTDPNGLGLTLIAEDDYVNSVKLNEVRVEQQIERHAIPAIEIAREIDMQEFCNLSAAQQQWLAMVMASGDVNPNSGGQVKAGLLACFGPTSETRTNLLGLLTESASRIEQMYSHELLEVGGSVTASDVAQARQLL